MEELIGSSRRKDRGGREEGKNSRSREVSKKGRGKGSAKDFLTKGGEVARHQIRHRLIKLVDESLKY